MPPNQVVITDLAESDIESSFLWWRDHRSADQAERRLDSIYPAIDSLIQMPERCSRVEERHLQEADLRQLLFGLGRRPTHRIVFEISDAIVTVLRVRHVAQQGLRSR